MALPQIQKVEQNKPIDLSGHSKKALEIKSTIAEIKSPIAKSGVFTKMHAILTQMEKHLQKIRDFGAAKTDVKFNEKTKRWHSPLDSNKMVKMADPRVVAEKALLEPKDDKEDGMLEQLKMIETNTRGLIKSGKSNAEDALEEEAYQENIDREQAERDKQRSTTLGGMWDSIKEGNKDSFFVKHWKKFAVGLFLAFAPLKWLGFLWKVIKVGLTFTKNHPLLAAILALTAYFTGGTLLKAIATKLGGAIAAGFAAMGGKDALMSVLKGSQGAASTGMGKAVGGAALLAGVALAIKDGMEGAKLSSAWGVSKSSGVAGAVLGGTSSGMEGAMANMGKWALIGAGIGSVVPGIGTLIGGLIGGAVGAILGWIGGERISKFFDMIGQVFSDAWKGVVQFFKDLWENPIGALKGLIKSWFGVATSIGSWFWHNAIKPVTDWLGNLFGIDITGTIESAAGKFADFGTWIYENAIKPIADWFTDLYDSAMKYIKNLNPLNWMDDDPKEAEKKKKEKERLQKIYEQHEKERLAREKKEKEQKKLLNVASGSGVFEKGVFSDDINVEKLQDQKSWAEGKVTRPMLEAMLAQGRLSDKEKEEVEKVLSNSFFAEDKQKATATKTVSGKGTTGTDPSKMSVKEKMEAGAYGDGSMMADYHRYDAALKEEAAAAGGTPQLKKVGVSPTGGATKAQAITPSESEEDSSLQPATTEQMPPSWEKRSKPKIDNLLHTGFKGQMKNLISGMWTKHGVDVGIASTTRGAAEQNALKESGASKAEFGKSLHNYGAAADVFFNKKGNIYEGPWDKLSSMGKGLGMRWGGDWKSFQDKPHFQVDMNWHEAKDKGLALAAAQGFSGIVKKPTVFLTGEAGPELVHIQPIVSPEAKTGALGAIHNENATLKGELSSGGATMLNAPTTAVTNNNHSGTTMVVGTNNAQGGMKLDKLME
jgi:hypothetical protein